MVNPGMPNTDPIPGGNVPTEVPPNPTPDPIRPEELPDWLSPTSEGWLRTDPGMLAEQGGMDGFFIARFVNKE